MYGKKGSKHLVANMLEVFKISPLTAPERKVINEDPDLNRVFEELKKEGGSLEVSLISDNSDIGSEISLRELLNSVIHKKDSCMIRKFNKKELNDLLIDNHKTNSHEEPTNKLIDYLAIRKQKGDNAGWLFCVKSIYDKDMDTAKVEFLYDKNIPDSYWESTKKKLDEIFFLGNNQYNHKIRCNLKSSGIYCSCTDENGCTKGEEKNIRIIPIIDYR